MLSTLQDNVKNFFMHSETKEFIRCALLFYWLNSGLIKKHGISLRYACILTVRKCDFPTSFINLVLV